MYREQPQHSAYRSAQLVKRYKAAFTQLYGSDEKPYVGRRKKDEGLSRWFAEEWRNQRGNVGYEKEGDIYRPTKRVSEKTPTTIQELTQPSQVKRSMSEKKKTGRVKRFDDEDGVRLLGYLFKRSSRKGKKLDAFDDNGQKVASFGDLRYQHYHDLTGLLPEKLNHGDPERRKRYYQRHGKTAEKGTPKWFSHHVLW